jgi:hypothetical protein
LILYFVASFSGGGNNARIFFHLLRRAAGKSKPEEFLFVSKEISGYS